MKIVAGYRLQINVFSEISGTVEITSILFLKNVGPSHNFSLLFNFHFVLKIIDPEFHFHDMSKKQCSDVQSKLKQIFQITLSNFIWNEIEIHRNTVNSFKILYLQW